MSVSNMWIMKYCLPTCFKNLKEVVGSGTRKQAESCLLNTHLEHSGLTANRVIVRE